MEVKPGYKTTAVGIIPKDWDVKRLGELGSIVRGGSPRPAGDSRYFNGDFVPWLTVAALTNISDYALEVIETVGFLTEEGSKHSRTLPADTLIIANSGATLGVAKVLGITCCANDGIAAIVNQRSGDKPFICYFINTKTKTLREVVATGNGQPNLNTGLIRTIVIPFPPLPEQRAIAAALSDVDALLVGLDRLIAKKRDFKQAAMQQLLTGQTRLPGFSEAWETVALIEIITKTAGFWGLEKKDVAHQNHVGVIRAGDISPDGKLTATATRYFSDSECAKAQCKIGDVVITGSGSVGKVWWCDGRADIAASNFVRILRPISKRVDGRYLFQLLLSEATQRLMVEHIATGVMANLSSSFFTTEWLHLPPHSEQRGIAEVLCDMDAELAALEARRDKTRDLKQAMMQELLTGKTRLVKPEAAHA
jgi:type I restriction enzyme S subunit